MNEEEKLLEESTGTREFFPQITPAITTPQAPEPFVTMLQGTPTNRFRAVTAKELATDLNGNAIIEREGFRASIKGYSTLRARLVTGAKKMLDIASIALGESNHYRAKLGQPIDTAVSISLQEFGNLRGYRERLTPRPTSTPEEEEAERKRLANVMSEIRKRANTELALLYALSFSWTEPGRKNGDYVDVRVLQGKGIRNGRICIRFGEDMARYLLHAAFAMNYPLPLLLADERNPITYDVGFKLAFHHSMDNNRTRGTNTIISVKKLLEASEDIPTFDEVQQTDRGHWARRIREPLETALDANVSIGVIQQWEYCNGRGVPLTEEQLSMPDYASFTKLYIRFEMQEEPDQTARLQRKAERIEARTEKAKKKAASKKKSKPK